MHQWTDLKAGLAEMRRVTPGPVVILSCDPNLVQSFWLNDYAPDVLSTEARRYPALTAIGGGRLSVLFVEIPLQCRDGFNDAYFGRPEKLPEEGAHRANSAWSFVPATTAAGYVEHLRSDLTDGSWDRRCGALCRQPEYDGSLRLIVSKG